MNDYLSTPEQDSLLRKPNKCIFRDKFKTNYISIAHRCCVYIYIDLHLIKLQSVRMNKRI